MSQKKKSGEGQVRQMKADIECDAWEHYYCLGTLLFALFFFFGEDRA